MQNSVSPEYPWYSITDVKDIPSPSLLIYPGRIEVNIGKMISIAGDPARLMPHVKTHKMAEVVRLQLNHGISKFKCATIAEAEMTAGAGANEILLALQPAGPNIDRFFTLQQAFPAVEFSCIVDSLEVAAELSEAAGQKNLTATLWLDINNGMNRTGIPPDKEAIGLFGFILSHRTLKAKGLHVYDGHLHEPDFSERKKSCDEAFKPVKTLYEELIRLSGHELSVVAGGTPTFPVHALRPRVETSPGTALLWDYGYSSAFSDLDFLHAAVVLTRVISKPAKDLICIDLGHKAVASEFPQPRVWLPALDQYEITGHNEEHMVIRSAKASALKVGDVLYGIPYHICPTVDRYDTVTVVTGGAASDEWRVAARKRRITV